MERTLHQPLTLPKYPDLLHEINEAIIAIKLHHTIEPKNSEEAEGVAKGRLITKAPSWEEMTELLRRAYNAINEQRENPRKYY